MVQFITELAAELLRPPTFWERHGRGMYARLAGPIPSRAARLLPGSWQLSFRAGRCPMSPPAQTRRGQRG